MAPLAPAWGLHLLIFRGGPWPSASGEPGHACRVTMARVACLAAVREAAGVPPGVDATQAEHRRLRIRDTAGPQPH
jgi:hypothetical protein